ncbi:MAG: aromatic ring-hydroxylating dioxygenase subunit alpha, partial [Actinobacteria bacterium]|nr:aromatic ring-hydroxylating dioxygenase subunit alpha [Actinomycetota bacterium]
YDLVTRFRGRPPEHAALWFCYYPNVMLEWYPEALAVSILLPRSPSSTTNVVEFFYPADVVDGRPDIIEAHQEAYGESADEDREIVDRIDRGRRALFAQGLDDAGPYQDPLEDGMVHFHRWLRSQLPPHLQGLSGAVGA